MASLFTQSVSAFLRHQTDDVLDETCDAKSWTVKSICRIAAISAGNESGVIYVETSAGIGAGRENHAAGADGIKCE